MSFLPSLPADAVLVNVFQRFPEVSSKLIEYHEVLMRGPSPLSVGERELIAGFVSSLNACQYCSGVHVATAEAFGVEAGLITRLIEGGVDEAPVTDALKPILHYVRILTEQPSRVTQDDVEKIFAAEWDEQALHDAVSVCALFNLMNRLVEGLGMRADTQYFSDAATRLHEKGYTPLLKMIGRGVPQGPGGGRD